MCFFFSHVVVAVSLYINNKFYLSKSYVIKFQSILFQCFIHQFYDIAIKLYIRLYANSSLTIELRPLSFRSSGNRGGQLENSSLQSFLRFIESTAYDFTSQYMNCINCKITKSHRNVIREILKSIQFLLRVFPVYFGCSTGLPNHMSSLNI